MSSEKCILKQGNTTVSLLEWSKSRTLTTPKAGEDMKQQEVPFIADGKATWYGHFRKPFGSFL